ncbi:copper resistance protein CopD [Flavobacterium piscis]|uniref:Copper resistance protein CopD n=1 Tax=Flavobacterium piscis TaxID=1114874 RepID=A0ABX2XTZ0_9FLAO|nr:CopD family protein [Flavobacterium piscis]OCB76041.1 copper resistance protein CopD [Flavobacterium piscis]OXG04893.1 copper resistance protein CopD [Flavobacterium piscis]
MTLHHILLIIHLIAATIWIGGHLTLSIVFLPVALRKKEPLIILNFEKKFEPLGISSLIALIITGIWMAYDFGITYQSWFYFSGSLEKVVSIKLVLLMLTFVLALYTQIYVIPNLNKYNLNKIAFSIISVTVIGLSMLILGSTIRYGGI